MKARVMTFPTARVLQMSECSETGYSVTPKILPMLINDDTAT